MFKLATASNRKAKFMPYVAWGLSCVASIMVGVILGWYLCGKNRDSVVTEVAELAKVIAQDSARQAVGNIQRPSEQRATIIQILPIQDTPNYVMVYLNTHAAYWASYSRLEVLQKFWKSRRQMKYHLETQEDGTLILVVDGETNPSLRATYINGK